MFQKAIRPKVKLKVILYGTPGSGKTYSSLRLAKGMGGKTAMINSEGERGYLNAGNFDYDILTLENNSPEAYIRGINAAVDAGYDNLIIDSVTHEWEYCLNKSNQKGSSFFAWKDITPRHNKFIQTIAFADINVICTARSKIEYSVTQDSNGKSNIEKVGTSITQRNGIEYEYMLSLYINQRHEAEVSKDNTGIFLPNVEVELTEKIGEKLIQRAKSGEAIKINALMTDDNKLQKAMTDTADELSIEISEDMRDKAKKLRAQKGAMVGLAESIKTSPMDAGSKTFTLTFINYASKHFETDPVEGNGNEVQNGGGHEYKSDQGSKVKESF